MLSDRRGEGPDHPRQLPGRRSTVTRADVEAMLNGDNYTRNGNICSAREYFQRCLERQTRLHECRRRTRTSSAATAQFYVNNLLIEEALHLAVADGVDLKQFDSRNQNIIDALNVLYAGQTQYRGELWPHNFNIDLQFGADAHRSLSAHQPGAHRRAT